MKPIYSTIPVLLCKYALINRMPNHLKLFVYLKYISGGHIRYNNCLIRSWATDLDLNEKTVRKLVKDLIKQEWITVNTNRGSLRAISYNQLCLKLKVNPKSAAVYEPDDFKNFKSFCCAVVITYYLKVKYWNEKLRLSESKKVDSSMSNHSSHLKGYKTLPVRYFSKCLGVSDTTANNFKKLAKEGGYIEVKRQVINMTKKDGKKIEKSMLGVIVKSDLDLAPRIRIGKKYIKKVDADLIKSFVKIKRKRNKYREKT